MSGAARATANPRLALTLVAVFLLVASYVLGFAQNITPEEARRVAQEYKGYIEGARRIKDPDAVAFGVFVNESLVILVCNTPVIGPVTAAYISFYSGYMDKALQVAGLEEATGTLEAYSLIEWVALVLATAEGLMLTYAFFRRRRVSPVETLASVLLQLSLIAIVAALAA